MFGQLGGLPVNSTAAKAGTGLGDTYTFTGSASYVLSPTFLVDTYVGVTTIEVTSEPDRIDEDLGLGYLGIPGTNGTERLYGGWPHFNITNYSNIGYAGSSHSPYIDDNWQVQYTANATWTKGAHTLKFGGDIVRQAMNRHELGDGSGSFTFGGGPTQIQGGPAGNQFNTIAAFLLGLPTGISKSVIPFENDYTRSRNWQFSFFARDQWQPTRKLTASLGLRYDQFPMGTRTTRGLERYDPDTNQMLICGVGPVPTDCGYDMGPGNWSPRAGLAYRLTERIVVRGGYGINYDPYPLAFVRNILGNYPSSISLSVPQPNALQPAGRLADGIPAITVPDISSGIIPVPLNVSARALPDAPKRGYIHSWNATVQTELPWGLTGQAGYVATRQRDINQIMDANAGQVIGAGNAGRPLFVRFGRTGATGILSNPGWSDYDSLQASLTRRLAQGVQANVAYTWSKAFGICCDTLSDNPPQVQALDYFSLNEARLPQDRPAQLPGIVRCRTAVRPRQAMAQRRRRRGSTARRLAGEWARQSLFRCAVHDHLVGNVTGPAGQHAVCRPGERRGRDSWRHRARSTVVRHDSISRRHRAAVRHGRRQQHARAGLREHRHERLPRLRPGRRPGGPVQDGNLQPDEHAAFRQPSEQRERQQLRRHQRHGQQRPRGNRRAAVPPRIEIAVLAGAQRLGASASFDSDRNKLTEDSVGWSGRAVLEMARASQPP